MSESFDKMGLEIIVIILLAIYSLFLANKNKRLKSLLRNSEVENETKDIANSIRNADVNKLISDSNEKRRRILARIKATKRE